MEQKPKTFKESLGSELDICFANCQDCKQQTSRTNHVKTSMIALFERELKYAKIRIGNRIIVDAHNPQQGKS